MRYHYEMDSKIADKRSARFQCHNYARCQHTSIMTPAKLVGDCVSPYIALIPLNPIDLFCHKPFHPFRLHICFYPIQ